MIDDNLYAERLKLCQQCEHYLKDDNRCVKVAIPEDPTRRGKLDHPLGIGNPKTRCPIRKFDYVKSAHALLMQEYLPWELNDIQMYQLTKVGITERNLLAWVSYIYHEFSNRGQTLLRSEIVNVLNRIRRINNN